MSGSPPGGPPGTAAPWLAKEFWGGIALVVIWLAVLFVGIWGGDIESTSAGGGSSSVPVVTAVALAALLATVSIGHWAFRQAPAEERLRRELEQERLARERLHEELEDLRAKLPEG